MSTSQDTFTVLLRIERDVGGLVRDMAHVKDRLGIIEPTLWKHEEERLQKAGFRKGISDYVTVGRVLWTTGLGAVIFWLWQHIAPFLPRV